MSRPSPGHTFLAASLCALLACGSHEFRAERQVDTAASAETRWIAPVPAATTGWLEAPAHVLSAPNDTAQVAPPLSARVVHVRATPGQRVAAGAALVDVVMPELLKAAGALRAAELRLDSWQRRRELTAPLVEKRLAQLSDLIDIDANIASVKGDIEAARAILRAAGEPDKRVSALLDGSGVVALRAPFAGVVVAVTAKVGEVREAAAGPLVELVSEDADALIEARFMTSPPEGVRFVWIDGAGSHPLTLERLSPHANERDGARTGWLHVTDGSRLVAGSIGRVQIVAASDWVAVPARALKERDGVTTVQRLSAIGSSAVPVRVVQRNAHEAIVTGLALEAKIAVERDERGQPAP